MLMHILNFSKLHKLSFLAYVIVAAININLAAASPDPVEGKNGMVVSASKLASKVGLKILQRGGNAIDAAVATGFALAVTYPSAGNIGGGGFMVVHLKSGENVTIDYREKAPSSAFETMYQDSSGIVIPLLSTYGVTSSGVPGSVAGLIEVLEKYGTMKLRDVIQPAIDLAEKGFILDAAAAQSFYYNLKDFKNYSSSLKIFSKNGLPFKAGDLFVQADLAKTLKLIRDKGRNGFYKGPIARLLLNQMEKDGGYITQKDLDDYKPIFRKPVEGTYRSFEVISMAPPSSGGIALIELLNILENYSFSKDEWGSSQYIFKLVEAMKFVYADRSKHLGDPDFYKVPAKELTSKQYAKTLFDRIKEGRANPSDSIDASEIHYPESKETTHYSIIDKEGNCVSTTTTLNSSYGAKVVVEGAGFLLNNEMDDFSSKPNVPNQFGLLGSKANSIQPGKRMLSSMTPTIILKDGQPFLIIGSPGGSTIITVVLQVILNCIDFNMNIQEAINAPRVHHQWKPDRVDYEEYGLSKDVVQSLQMFGENLGNKESLGRAEGIMINYKTHKYYGATDPRGNGSAEGY